MHIKLRINGRTLVVVLRLILVLKPDPALSDERNLARALRRARLHLKVDLARLVLRHRDRDRLRRLLVRLGGRRLGERVGEGDRERGGGGDVGDLGDAYLDVDGLADGDGGFL